MVASASPSATGSAVASPTQNDTFVTPAVTASDLACSRAPSSRSIPTTVAAGSARASGIVKPPGAAADVQDGASDVHAQPRRDERLELVPVPEGLDAIREEGA